MIYKKRDGNSSRIFIMGLAIIDLLTCTVMVPFTFAYILNTLNEVANFIYNFLMKFLFVLICFIFTSISIDRYYALAKPLAFALDETKAKRVIGLNVFLTLTVVLTMMVLQEYLSSVFAFFVLLLFILFVIIVIVMYSLAFNALRLRSKSKIGQTDESSNNTTSTDISNNTSNSAKKPKKESKNKKSKEAIKTAKVLLTITGLFIFSYTPFMIRSLLPESIRMIVEFTLFFNNVINFLIYCQSSERFRKECKNILLKK